MGVSHLPQAAGLHRRHAAVWPDGYERAPNPNTHPAQVMLDLSSASLGRWEHLPQGLPALPSLPRDDVSAWDQHHGAGSCSSTSSEFYCPSQHPSRAKPEVQNQPSCVSPSQQPAAAPFGRSSGAAVCGCGLEKEMSESPGMGMHQGLLVEGGRGFLWGK